MKREDLINQLNELTSSHNFINVIAILSRDNFSGTIKDLYDRNPFNFLNYNEISFLIGLWIKNSSKSKNEIKDYQHTAKLTHSLMDEIHKTFIPHFDKKSQSGKTINEIMLDGLRFQETFFYTASGGYDFQFIETTKKKYKHDEDWIVKNKGFSLDSLGLFFDNIKRKGTNRLNNPSNLQSDKNILDLYIFSKDELTLSNPEFESILNSFTIKLGNNSITQLNKIGDYNEFASKPIIETAPHTYFIPFAYLLAEAIYESPFYWMNIDKSYSPISLKNRGLVAEDMVYNLIKGVCKESNVFKGVKINKSNRHTITDIDIITFHKDEAIIFQVKSKKLTNLSKQGNLESIKSDFKKAIEDAFLQGISSEECILDSINYDFITDEGINLSEKIKAIKKVHTVCIVLDFFPAITNAIQILLYGKHKKSTIAFSILDLEIICSYLCTPAKLFDYLTKRIENCRYYHADNELCFLGYYLKHNLKKVQKSDGIIVDNSFGGIIDKDYYPALMEKHNYHLTPSTFHSSARSTSQNNTRKIGRNEKCPCGSGEKNKDCHKYTRI